MLAIVAIFPIVLALLLMTAFHQKSGRSLFISWIVGILIALLIWKMDFKAIMAYSVSGFINSLDIICIIFGATLLLAVLRKLRITTVLQMGFSKISRDRRIQTMMIPWFFGAFIESVAGFGAPAALAAPLLTGLGFPPFGAVMVSLIANSTCVSYGNVGTPSQTLFSTLGADIAANGLNAELFASQLYGTTAVFHATFGIFVPTIMVFMLTYFFGEKKSIKPALESLPLSLFAGFAFCVPYVLLGVFLGSEFPSMLGGIIGFVIMLIAVKSGFLVPKNVWLFPGEKLEDEGGLKEGALGETLPDISLVKAWAPYGCIALFLFITRLRTLPFRAFIGSFGIKFTNLLGVEGVNRMYAPLNYPGIIPFMLVAVITALCFRMKASDFGGLVKDTFNRTKNAAIALLTGIALVQIMMNTNMHNASGMVSMVATVANTLADIFGKAYFIPAPFIGVLGAFVSGSNAMSNVLFGSLQFNTAQQVGLSTVMICALQNCGGAIGNMICVNNVVAACATVGCTNDEGRMILKNLGPCLIYTLWMVLVGAIVIGIGYGFMA